jgi:hypothetical protein
VYLKLLLDRRPRQTPAGHSVGRLESSLNGLRVERKQVASYQAICGFPSSPVLPVTFPHIVVAGLHMQMLLDPGFPVRLTGLVHLWHRIRQFSQLGVDEDFDFSCWLEGSKMVDAGEEFCLHTELRRDGELCWSEQTGFISLSKNRQKGLAHNPVRNAVGDHLTSWNAASNIGRRYARVSADFNPIHLSNWSAKLFGFRSPIAHGMWTLARSVAALHTGNDADISLEAKFLRPVYLPSTIQMFEIPRGQERHFQLTTDEAQRICVQGTFATH